MLKLDPIIAQVKENCDIADANHAGLYSICGLAMRLRDLYKWDMGLEAWKEGSSSEVLAWIGEKEQKWYKLAEKSFYKITIASRRYDPFDIIAINNVLEPHGIFYGAGYAHSIRPTFFLACIAKKREMNNCRIYILGRELARDLFTTPALSQEGSILIRQESAQFFLWDNIFYIKKSGREALRFALANYGLNDINSTMLRAHLKRIVEAETEAYIHHELGEIHDSVFNRALWREIIGTFPHSAIELLARSIKDLLADTNEYGTLRHISKERKTASLAFYVAFLDGLRKTLFPEIIEAFQVFMRTCDWNLIEDAIVMGHNTAQQYAETIINIYQSGKKNYGHKWIEAEISKRLLTPLGV
jgi:hypothetical protein